MMRATPGNAGSPPRAGTAPAAAPALASGFNPARRPGGRSRQHPVVLGPVRRYIVEWLKLWAYGHRSARRRKELVAAVQHQVDVGIEGFRWLADARDLDREVRKMCRQCLELGYPALSRGTGYYYGNPQDPRDRMHFERQIRTKAMALLLQRRQVRWAMEAEAKRLAGERQPKQIETMITATGAGA